MGNDTEQVFNSGNLNAAKLVVDATVLDAPEAAENHAAVQAQLRAAAPQAAKTLEQIAKGRLKRSAAELRVMLDGAKAILDRAGHGPSAGAPPPGAEKNFSRPELESMMQALLANAGDKAIPVTIDAQQAISDLLD